MSRPQMEPNPNKEDELPRFLRVLQEMLERALKENRVPYEVVSRKRVKGKEVVEYTHIVKIERVNSRNYRVFFDDDAGPENYNPPFTLLYELSEHLLVQVKEKELKQELDRDRKKAQVVEQRRRADTSPAMF